MPSITPAQYSQAGGKRHVTVKKLKTVLKKAGLKTSGKKSTLTRRVKKAHLKLRGGQNTDVAPEVKEQVAGAVATLAKEEGAEAPAMGGRRRRGSRKGSRKH